MILYIAAVRVGQQQLFQTGSMEGWSLLSLKPTGTRVIFGKRRTES